MSIGSGDLSLTLFTGPALFSLVNQMYLLENMNSSNITVCSMLRMGESEEVKELERMLEEEERDSDKENCH